MVSIGINLKIGKTMHNRILIGMFLLSLSSLTNSQNLIHNPSFEENGKPFCEGWYDRSGSEFKLQCDSISYFDTNIIHKSAPDSNNGAWCLEVRGSFPFSGYAATYITGQEGTFIYQLKFWMNTEHFLGEAYFGPIKNGIFIDSNYIQDFSQPWTEYKLLDTISTNITDTIGVFLTASIGDFCLCDVAFDQIELTVIDTLSTSIPTPDPNVSIVVFPNPFTDNVTFLVPGLPEFNVSVFDITGKEIKHAQSDGDMISMDMTSESAGIYFYQLASIDHKIYLGRGKMIKL
jgi:hypothetical protein